MIVLDKGYLKLLRVNGLEGDIVDAARVCTGSCGDEERDAKLLRYLYNNGHTSPLEMMSFTFAVKAPIFVARQWMRHRTWSYNEASQRYKESPLEFYVPSQFHNSNNAGRPLSSTFTFDGGAEYFESTYTGIAQVYKNLLDMGVAKEQARIVLPLATYTEFVAQCDLNNLLKFLEQRLHPRAQWEIRQYAIEIAKHVEIWAPTIWGCFSELHKEGIVQHKVGE